MGRACTVASPQGQPARQRLAARLDRDASAGEKAAMSFWIKLLLGVAAAYVLVALAGYFGQRKLMYFPDRERVQPGQVGLAAVEERVLKTPDGARVIAWYGKARPGQPTLLYFHGNGGALSVRAERIRRFMAEGWGVYMMTYRGYGGSTGRATEVANVADARLAYGALVLEGVPPTSIILYGESLGTGIATRIAVERQVAGLILEAPYTSIVDVAAQAYPFLPVRALLTDRYETTKYIAHVKVPLLILHGARDGVVPVMMGRELARLANEPKRLVVFPDGRHSNIYVDGNNALAAVRQWIGALER
ncbi:MAG: lysophospholipase [Hyphomonadaceae bacterium]|nr:lysophospholipase [Hyphomonadaceae bacterium]